MTSTPVMSTKDPATALPLRPLPMRQYPIVSGPFSHLAAERERLAGLTWRSFNVMPIGATIGAEIAGVGLADDLGDDVVAELRQALFDYKVLFFRDQPMTPAQHVAFARRFGELEVHPFIPSNTGQPELVRFAKSEDVAGYENSWHHDVTWREKPSMAAVLHGLSIPDRGGDTLFADMYAAYDVLDDGTKAEIENLEAVHDFTAAFGRSVAPEQADEMRRQYPPVRHPVVCTHAATGRRHLYVNRIFVSHIEGMDPAASSALIDRLCRQADYPEHQCRFRWSPDAVAFWDNRAVQHYAASDYWPAARVMERASITGDRPRT